jgi:translation initiation factor IF-1
MLCNRMCWCWKGKWDRGVDQQTLSGGAENGHRILDHISGKLRMNFIGYAQRPVKVEMTTTK